MPGCGRRVGAETHGLALSIGWPVGFWSTIASTALPPPAASAASAAGHDDSFRYGQVTSAGGAAAAPWMDAATTRQIEESTAACPIESDLM